MRSEPDKIQSASGSAEQEFKRDKQDEFLFDELRWTLEETRNNCDHNNEMIDGSGCGNATYHSFIAKECGVCGEKIIVPDPYEHRREI